MRVFSTEFNRLTYDQVVRIFTEFKIPEQNYTDKIEFPKSGNQNNRNLLPKKFSQYSFF
jgi:hypothetical protein